MAARTTKAAPPAPAPGASAPLGEEVFRLLFERSADAILLLDSRTFRFVDCNDAAFQMLGGRSKRDVLDTNPWQLSPERQPMASSPLKRPLVCLITSSAVAHIASIGCTSAWMAVRSRRGRAHLGAARRPSADRHRLARHHGAEARRARDARDAKASSASSSNARPIRCNCSICTRGVSSTEMPRRSR
jgi:PAS domain-containing protein